MRRWIGGLLAALLVAVPLLALDKDKDKGADEKSNDRAKQLKALQEDFRKATPDAIKTLRAAKTAKERQAVLEKLSKTFSPRAIKLVEADPKDKLSLDVLLWAVQNVPSIDPKLYDLLGEYWAKDAKLKSLCQKLMEQPEDAAEKMLQKVLDSNSDKDIQGFACYGLAQIAIEKANRTGDKAFQTVAEKKYERINKDFAEVKAGRGTLGDQTKDALSEIQHFGIGATAPNVESENLEGKKVQLKDYKGKVVVLDIWATWCPPCRAMIPHEREMVEKLKDKPFALISISADAKKDTLTKFIEDTPMPWTHWWNGQTGGILKDWKVQHYPTIYVLDAKGVIRYKEIRGEDLDVAVEKLLAEVKK
jgi:thiol-disulfide isomerase/thioredoxin